MGGDPAGAGACGIDPGGAIVIRFRQARRLRRAILAVALIIASPMAAQSLPAELDGWPVVELTRVTRANGEVWVGTYGHGVLVRPPGSGDWRQIQSDTSKTSLSWDFVHAIAFGPRDQVWVGTIGNGWGLSRDNGRTWRNWTFSELGPEWQYVAREGIVTRGDTTAIATADGMQVSIDDGQHWIAVVDSIGPAAKGPADTALRLLANEYLLSLRDVSQEMRLRAPELSVNERVAARLFIGQLPRCGDHGQEHGLRIDRVVALQPPEGMQSLCVRASASDSRIASLVDSLRRIMPPWGPRFARPISPDNNPYIDQTYRFGSTMGGNFQPHQGVEFNNPDGTPVMAIGPGVVAFSGPAERGALTVAIRHDSLLTLPDGSRRYVYSVYYHNNELVAQVGARVGRGDTIARVGHTGRATNDHLHLEVHASPIDSVKYIVDPEVRFPPYVTNPELWIEPLPGTGVIAGRVLDAAGNAVPQARIYGITKPEPRETPFAFAETYGPRNNPSPMYGEHFAISDVPPGVHTLRAKIGDQWIERRVTVAPGVMTWVEFRP